MFHNFLPYCDVAAIFNCLTLQRYIIYDILHYDLNLFFMLYNMFCKRKAGVNTPALLKTNQSKNEN